MDPFKIKCPYDEFTLQFALLGLEKKITDSSIIEKINSESSDIDEISTKADLNKKIAEHEGISVMELLNSTNYALLKQEYLQILESKKVHYLLELLEKESFTNKEAWAILAVGTGSLQV